MQQNTKTILEQYINGKDDDQAEILEKIYSEESKVLFEIIPDTISFPGEIQGNINIAKVLSKDFNKKHDNVKTYYLSDDPEQFGASNILGQQWLVIMRDKDTHQIKIGTGLYDWYFTNKEDNILKISHHKITIGVMLCFDDENLNFLNDLQSKLPYPWVSKQQVLKILKEDDLLKEIEQYLVAN